MQTIIPDRFYREYPAVWFFILFAAGIALSRIFLAELSLTILLPAVLLLFIGGVICHFYFSKIFPIMMFTGVFLLGVTRLYLTFVVFPDDHLIQFAGKNVTSFQGWISEAHYQKEGRHRYILECTQVVIDSSLHVAQGKVLITQGRFARKLYYGQAIQITGAPQRPQLPGNPGEFNYRHYLQLNDVYFQYSLDENNCHILPEQKGAFFQKHLLDPVRRHISMVLQNNIPAPTNAMIEALFMGERQDVDRSIIADFQKTGVIHILAISGWHVSFALMIFLLIFSMLRFPFKWKIGMSLLLLFIYVALVNFIAPVVRSAVMATLYFGAQLSERRSNSINIMAVAGLLILFVAPQQLFIAGFQFSFAAVFGILYGYPKLKKMLPFVTGKSKWKAFINKWIFQPLLVSAAAILATSPLTWYHYGVMQIGALLINLFIIPATAAFMTLSFIFLLLASTGFFALDGMAQILHLLCLGILKALNFMATWPFMQLQIPRPSILLIVLFLAGIYLIFNLTNRRRLAMLGVIVCIIIFFSDPHQNKALNKLRVTFVDVGQGDAAIVEFPNGDNVVIDAGDRKGDWDEGGRYVAPLLKYFGIGRIKYLAGTHGHSDHVGGFAALLDQFKIDTLVLSPYLSRDENFLRLMQKAQSMQLPVVFRKRGQTLPAGEECRIYFLHPDENHISLTDCSGDEVNNSSLVTKICYGKTSFLLTGDLESDAERMLAGYRDFLKADVLKVGHHGSKTSTSQGLLDWVQPQYGVVSVGRRNRFFHPSKQTLQRLEENGAIPLRTDHFGAIMFESDGKEVRLINWRK